MRFWLFTCVRSDKILSEDEMRFWLFTCCRPSSFLTCALTCLYCSFRSWARRAVSLSEELFHRLVFWLFFVWVKSGQLFKLCKLENATTGECLEILKIGEGFHIVGPISIGKSRELFKPTNLYPRASTLFIRSIGMRLIVHHRAVCVSTEVGILLGKIKIIGVLFSGGKAGGGSGGQKWMVKVPRPSQKISYNLFRDTFCQEFVHSESLEVGAQKFWYSVLYWFLVHNSMKLISIKKCGKFATDAVEKLKLQQMWGCSFQLRRWVLLGLFATIYFFVNYLSGGLHSAA